MPYLKKIARKSFYLLRPVFIKLLGNHIRLFIQKGFEREIAFFSQPIPTSLEEMDYDLLGAKMRETAHVLDKDLYFEDRPRSIAQRRKLERIIAVWKKKYPQDEITFRWAVKTLDSHYRKWGKRNEPSANN